MNEFTSATFLIVDYRKYSNDIVFIGISPFEGQRYVVIKGGSRGTSRRAKSIDMGNLIKAKIYQRNHWYLSESEALDSFSFIKHDLELIVLFQALLAVLKIAYVLPEKKLYYSIYHTLRGVETISTKERQELSMFLLLMKVLSHYDLAQFPFNCAECGRKIYEGAIDPGTLGYFCAEHSKLHYLPFSIKTSTSRIEMAKLFLKHLLNINFVYTPIENTSKQD